jgi:hypothetical protein
MTPHTKKAGSPYGPYVPPNGGAVECTIIVKAAPERSKKYGETVCTAAILDDGRLIRFYPVYWEEYAKKEIPKYQRIRVHVIPSDEPARRPESHHKEGAFKLLPSPLLRKGNKTPWYERSRLLLKAVTPNGMTGLRDKQGQHRTSLGIVRVKELIDFRITAPLDEIIEQADFRVSPQQTLTGKVLTEGSKIDKVKHVFRYRWRCFGECCADGKNCHDTTCEDWELFQSFRSWRERYPYEKEFLEKIREKYYDTMGQTNLHFIMGTPSHPVRQTSWMIVGLFYPHIKRIPDPDKPTLCSKDLAPKDLLDINSKMDHEIEKYDTKPKSGPKRSQGTLDLM